MNEEHLDSAATMLAAAYWRGKLDTQTTDPVTLEAMVKAAAEADNHKWRGSARVLLGLVA